MNSDMRLHRAMQFDLELLVDIYQRYRDTEDDHVIYGQMIVAVSSFLDRYGDGSATWLFDAVQDEEIPIGILRILLSIYGDDGLNPETRIERKNVLLSALRFPLDEARWPAVASLGKMGDKSVVPILVRYLKNSSHGMRQVCIEALVALRAYSVLKETFDGEENPSTRASLYSYIRDAKKKRRRRRI